MEQILAIRREKYLRELRRREEEDAEIKRREEEIRRREEEARKREEEKAKYSEEYDQNIFMENIKVNVKCVENTDDPFHIEMCLADLKKYLRENPQFHAKLETSIDAQITTINDIINDKIRREVIKIHDAKRAIRIMLQINEMFNIKYDIKYGFEEDEERVRQQLQDEELARQLQLQDEELARQLQEQDWG
jgi:hypothetical protein